MCMYTRPSTLSFRPNSKNRFIPRYIYLPASRYWLFVFFQQVHHYVPLRQLQEQRLRGGGGILGRLLQQRAEPSHLRVLQPGLPGRVQEDPGELLRGDRASSGPAPGPSEAGPGAQQRVLGVAREQSAESQRDDERAHRGVHLSVEPGLLERLRVDDLLNRRGSSFTVIFFDGSHDRPPSRHLTRVEVLLEFGLSTAMTVGQRRFGGQLTTCRSGHHEDRSGRQLGVKQCGRFLSIAN